MTTWSLRRAMSMKTDRQSEHPFERTGKKLQCIELWK